MGGWALLYANLSSHIFVKAVQCQPTSAEGIYGTLFDCADGSEPLLLFLLAAVPTFCLLLREAKPQIEASSTQGLVYTALPNRLQSIADLIRGNLDRAKECTFPSTGISEVKPVFRQGEAGIPILLPH